MADDVARNLRLSFEHREGRNYLVSAVLGDGPPVTSTFTLPLSDDELERVLDELGETRSLLEHVEAEPATATTRAASVVPRRKQTADKFGTELFDRLFVGEVGELFENEHEAGVQLRFALTEQQTELLKIPWEFLCRRGIFVAAQPKTPVLRELWTGDRPPGARDAPDKIRILAVSASPPGFEQLDTQRERAQIRAVIDAHETAAELTWIDDCTYDLLHEALGENPQVLHFVGHSFCDDNGDAGLILAKADGSVHQVSALAFTNLLDRADSLDLIVLNSCEGFRAVDGHPYASLAAKIVRASQGAVIAMQFKITDDAAIKFSGELYKRLIRDRYSIDRAMSEARTAVMGVNEIEFATPVLYLRDGRTDLFAAVGEASDTTLVPNAVTTNAAPARTSHLGVRVLSLQLPNLVGDDIAELQTRLRRVGVDTGPVDGLYGPRTTQAVQDFQSTAGLVVDGVCGETTIEALARAERAVAGQPAVTAVPAAVDPGSAPGPDRRVPPATPAPSGTPATPRRSTTKGVLIGAGAAVAAFLALALFIGRNAGDSTSAGSSTGAASTSAAGAGAVTTAALVPATASSAAAIDAEDLIGIIVDHPGRPDQPRYVVPLSEPIPDFDDDCDAFEWASENGAMVSEGGPALEPVTSITLQAKQRLATSGVAVLVKDIEIDVVDWRPPMEGLLVDCPGLPLTDAGAPIEADVRLPSRAGDQATIAFRVNDSGSGAEGTVGELTSTFPRQTLLPGETILFDIYVDAAGCECEWWVLLELVVNGEELTYELGTDEGDPFWSSGSSRSTPMFAPPAG